MNKIKYLSIFAVLFTIFACKRDDLDLEKFSLGVESQIAVPLVFGSYDVNDLIEEGENDTLLIINGDTVKVVLEKDAFLYFSAKELLDIPEQNNYNYSIISPENYLISGLPYKVDLDSFANDTLYPFVLNESMRIDSINLKTGNFLVEVTNTFNHDVTLRLSSVSLLDNKGIYFQDSISNIAAGETVTASFPIDDYKVVTHQSEGRSVIYVRFSPVLFNNTDEDYIKAGNGLHIKFGIDDLNDHYSIFGFFGFQHHDKDTILTIFDIPEAFNKLKGELSNTNPKVRIDYYNTVGVSLDLNVLLNLVFNDDVNVQVDLGRKRFDCSKDYRSPDYFESLIFDSSNVDNIGEIISFPFYDSLSVYGEGYTNYGMDSATTNNWSLASSDLTLDLDVEVPLRFSADLQYTDTVKFQDEISDSTNFSYDIDYAYLYYKFENYFPLSLGVKMVLFDSTNNLTYDTIVLTKEDSDIIVEAAPVDDNGEVINESVESYDGEIELDPDAAERLLNKSTHIILISKIITSDYGSVESVRIATSNKLNFQFGIDAKGEYREQ